MSTIHEKAMILFGYSVLCRVVFKTTLYILVLTRTATARFGIHDQEVWVSQVPILRPGKQYIQTVMVFVDFESCGQWPVFSQSVTWTPGLSAIDA